MPNDNSLTQFLADCLSMGCLRGFLHFELYLRGKEELICRVNLTESAPPAPNGLLRTKLFISNRSQYSLIEQTSKIAPASPCDRELEKDRKKAAFLLAGYGRYKYPFVWLRSNHKILLDKFKIDPQKVDQDSPLRLTTTAEWSTKDIKCFHIVAEIVQLTLGPSYPLNPFAIDHDYFNTLPLSESVAASAAMIDFLNRVHMSNPDYAEAILQDIQRLQKRHFSEIFELVRQNRAF